MELVGLRDFVAVARAGSFAEAARVQGVAKSTLSKRVQDLESDLGVRLMDRTSRALRLTPEGALVLERARRLLSEADELRAAVDMSDVVPRGHLRLACPPMFGHAFMGELSSAYLKAFPATTLEAVFTDRLVDLVEEGFDCAIRVLDEADSTLMSRTFARARGIVVATPAFAEAHPELVHPAQLSQIPFVGIILNGRVLGWSLVRGNEAVDVAPGGPLFLGGMTAVLEAVRLGTGAAGLPEFLVADDLASGRLVRLLPEWSAPERALRVVYPAGRHLAARVRAFIDLLADRFPGGQVEHTRWLSQTIEGDPA